MAKSGKRKPWEPAFRRIRSLYWPQCVYPPKPTAADLDDAERELNFHFPASYRAFAEEFGLDGELHSLPRVLPLTRPTGATEAEWFRSVIDATRFYHTHDWDGHAGAPLAFLQRVVVFAMDGSYYHWAFDPMEVTNARLREYRIYDIDRLRHATAVAASFDEWLDYIDRNYRFEREEGEPEEPEFPPVFKPDSPVPDAMIYWPNYLRSKEQLGKRSVKLWLACNDGAAMGLARAVREDGKTNVLPILADALEEAGCQNRDLLDACRYGDPDIDGAWALQVLLGKTPVSG